MDGAWKHVENIENGTGSEERMRGSPVAGLEAKEMARATV